MKDQGDWRTFSNIFSSSACIITTHSPLLVSQTSARLLMPWHLQSRKHAVKTLNLLNDKP